MGYFITENNEYYEGDQISPLDVPIPQRQNPTDIWNGSVWVSQPYDKAPLLDLVREARETALDRLMGIAFAAAQTNDTSTVSACLSARTALLNITTDSAVVESTDELSFKLALLNAYTAIKNAAPINVKNAFAAFNI